MIYKMTLKDSVGTMTFNLLETPIVDKDIEGAVDNVTLDGNQYTDYLYLKKQYIQKWAIMCPDEYDELRGFYTRQFEDGEVPSYRVYYGANVTRDYTLNGDYLQFNAEGIETGMTLSQLLGNAEQTTYSGKNLCPNPLEYGIYNENGAKSGSDTGSVRSTTQLKVAPSTQYIFSCNGARINAWLYEYDANGAYISGTRRLIPQTAFTTGSTTHFVTFFKGSDTGLTGYQLELGSTPTSYEPYVGGTASPNPDYPQPISTVTGEQTVKITGKNLWNSETAVTYSNNANTFITDGWLQFKTSGLRLSYPLDVPIGSTLTFSATVRSLVSSQNVIAMGFLYEDGSTSSITPTLVLNDTDEHTFTVTATSSSLKKLVAIRTGNTSAQNAQFKLDTIQLELGSTATAYESYQSQSYEANLGKNLLDNKATTRTYLGVTLTKNNDGSITLNGTPTGDAQFYLDVDGVGFQGRNSHLGAGTYTLNGRDSGGVKFEINYKTANGNSLYSRGTFTAAEPFDYGVYVNVTNGTTVNNLRIYPQLERGSQATPYAPYFPPIELAKIGDYQDRIYKDDGKWYIEKQIGKVVLDGTEANIGTYPYGTNSYLMSNTGVASTPTSSQLVISDHFVSMSYDDRTQNVQYMIYSDGGTAGQIDFRNTTWTSLADFKTWLGTHNTTVYYALATPTTTEITDETLLYQLNFLASLYEGVNNISLVGTGAQGEMEVFIRDVMSVETDVVPEVPVRLTLTDDGVINACGCRRNVQLTMRETVQ